MRIKNILCGLSSFQWKNTQPNSICSKKHTLPGSIDRRSLSSLRTLIYSGNVGFPYDLPQDLLSKFKDKTFRERNKQARKIERATTDLLIQIKRFNSNSSNADTIIKALETLTPQIEKSSAILADISPYLDKQTSKLQRIFTRFSQIREPIGKDGHALHLSVYIESNLYTPSDFENITQKEAGDQRNCSDMEITSIPKVHSRLKMPLYLTNKNIIALGSKIVGRGGQKIVKNALIIPKNRQESTIDGVWAKFRARTCREIEFAKAFNGEAGHVDLYAVQIKDAPLDKHENIILKDISCVMERFDDSLNKITLYWADVPSLGLQIFPALEKMHERSLIHGDIKPHNILFNETEEKMIYALTDYGLTRDIGERTNCFAYGTPMWSGPETFGLQPGIENVDMRPADIWALGLTMLEKSKFDQDDDNDDVDLECEELRKNCIDQLLNDEAVLSFCRDRYQRKVPSSELIEKCARTRGKICDTSLEAAETLLKNNLHSTKVRLLHAIMKMIASDPNKRPTAGQAYTTFLELHDECSENECSENESVENESLENESVENESQDDVEDDFEDDFENE